MNKYCGNYLLGLTLFFLLCQSRPTLLPLGIIIILFWSFSPPSSQSAASKLAASQSVVASSYSAAASQSAAAASSYSAASSCPLTCCCWLVPLLWPLLHPLNMIGFYCPDTTAKIPDLFPIIITILIVQILPSELPPSHRKHHDMKLFL